MCDHASCGHHAPSSTTQTLLELDFERGLWVPAREGDLKEVQRRTFKGHNVNETDSSGYSPLLYAVRSGHYEVCKFLLEQGANPNHQTLSGKTTSLHRASQFGHPRIVQLLVDSGADIHLVDVDGDTPLHKAAHANHLDIVSLLLQSGANPLLMNCKEQCALQCATDPSVKEALSSHPMYKNH